MKKLYSFLTAAAVSLSAVAGINQPVNQPTSPSLESMAKSKISRLTLSTPASQERFAAPAKAAATGQWSEWESLGTGTFTMDDTFAAFTGLDEWQGEFPGIGIEVRHDTGDDNIRQFKLSPIFNDATMIVDYNAATGKTRVARQETNIDMDGLMLQVMDFATCYEVIWGNDPEHDPEEVAMLVEAFDQYNYYIEALGRIYLFLGFTFDGYDDVVAMSDVTFQIDGCATGVPEIEMPAYYAPGDKAKGSIILEEGIPTAKVGFFKGIMSQRMLNAVLTDAEGVFEVESGVEFDMPVANPNDLMAAVAVTYLDGEPLDYSVFYCTCIDDEEGQWKSLGEGEITTDLMETVFGLDPNIVKVEVQQNIANPGIYRAVDSYGEKFPYNDPGEFDTDYKHYLVFDASDPECVILQLADLGIIWKDVARFFGGSLGAYYMDNGDTFETIKENNLGGKLEDGIITFPDKSLVITSNYWELFGGQKDQIYYGNKSTKMALTIPTGNDVTGVEDIMVENEGDSVYFNLQGVRVDNPAHGTVVIRANNGKAQKVLIR